ncbi:MAG: hypothetical protein ACLR5S_09120 [Ruminococcus sp.]
MRFTDGHPRGYSIIQLALDCWAGRDVPHGEKRTVESAPLSCGQRQRSGAALLPTLLGAVCAVVARRPFFRDGASLRRALCWRCSATSSDGCSWCAVRCGM